MSGLTTTKNSPEAKYYGVVYVDGDAAFWTSFYMTSEEAIAVATKRAEELFPCEAYVVKVKRTKYT
jgi:valyl-tRNA synthetase